MADIIEAMPNFPPVDEQLAYIKKGSAEIIRESELREKLENAQKLRCTFPRETRSTLDTFFGFIVNGRV